MKITPSVVRGVYATAAALIPADGIQAEPRHLREAVSKAIDCRHGDEAFSDQTKIRRKALGEAPEWSCRWTRKDLVGELHRSARHGLDLAELVGERYGSAAARIWFHGSYSSARVRAGFPPRQGLSIGGRPWLWLWPDDDSQINPTIVRAAYAS
ncbi:hypothetical protein [Streptomyces sp. DH12]|uniref:hypothetical protein n=1 Tax=Streptomyces sp. DH12 TaxID=2857010 RepID=UPI001E63F1E0|nr:hypothetical protein [Streptomyces sp. DH12]